MGWWTGSEETSFCRKLVREMNERQATISIAQTMIEGEQNMIFIIDAYQE
jgi:hypothetical protein